MDRVKVEKLAEDLDELMVDLRVYRMVEMMAEKTVHMKVDRLAG